MIIILLNHAVGLYDLYKDGELPLSFGRIETVCPDTDLLLSFETRSQCALDKI